MSSDRAADGPSPKPTMLRALVHPRTLFTVLMFAIFVVMVYIAWGYAWPANFLPLVIGLPGIAITLLQIALDVRDYFRQDGKIDPRTDFEKYMDEITEHSGVQMEVAEGTKLETLVEDPSLHARSRNKREALLFAYFFGFIGVVLLLGFWIGFPIFMLAFLRFYARETWKLSVTLTTVTWIVMYLLVVVLLGQILFEGFVTSYVMDTWFYVD